MGYIATDLARVPGIGFEWYVFLLEDSWNDDLRRELSDNFENLAKEVGPKALVVRGAEPQSFYDQVFYKYALHKQGFEGRDFPLPALLIADMPPMKIRENKEWMQKAKMILLPLAIEYRRPESIADFLKKVAQLIQDPETFDALNVLDRTRIERKWGWLSRYLILKPNFYGFGVDLNQIIEDIFLQRKRI